MTTAIKWSCCPMFTLLFLAMAVSTFPVQGRDSRVSGPSGPAADWWSVSDIDFVKQYGSLATGTQKQQSQFAWMTFARVNQQVSSPANKQTFSQWELWPSDPETFTPDSPQFNAATKVRTRPHLQPIQQLRLFSLHKALQHTSPFPKEGQEVTRNPVSYGYITGKHLNSQKGLASYLGQQGNRIEFPLGAVETKAVWARGALAGAYQVGGFSLTALHLMVKVKPAPANPFTSNDPSWFWTTFELKSNPGLAAAQKFITYGDALTAAESRALLMQAGLGNTPFTNYLSNGQQVQFFDAQNATIILGNTQLEWAFATPPSRDPTTWKSWSSSCHSCHGQASGKIDGSGMDPFDFTAPVGPLNGAALPGPDYRPYDFVWALALAQ